jgi:hypothetical protein
MPTKTKTKPAARSAEPKTKTPEPATPETAEAPDWVNETPDDNSYSLQMHAWDGDNPQSVRMSRREFILTKRMLAALRGLPLGAPREHWDYSPVRTKDHTPEEMQQLTLEITQEELEMVMDFERVSDEMSLNLRRRLRLGAKVEPGKWHLDEGAADIIESYEGETVGTCRCGLDIHLVRETKTGAAGA